MSITLSTAKASVVQHDQKHTTVVALEQLCKTYGDLQAVKDLSLEIFQGEIFGLLGPNGAGKTTTLEMTVGLRTPTSGSIHVLGHNPHTEHAALVDCIGVQPQEASLFPTLKVVETLRLFESFHRQPLSTNAVLAKIGLEEKRKSSVKSLSGGQRQRLLIGLALISDPQILFLDEPTGSLDPQARRQLWDVIADFRQQNRTVILTTHSMEEAEALCDRVAIIDQGQIIALGSPAQLIRQYFPVKTIRLVPRRMPASSFLQALSGVNEVSIHGEYVELTTSNCAETLQALTGHIEWDDIEIRSGSLEDVFLSLTGRMMRD